MAMDREGDSSNGKRVAGYQSATLNTITKELEITASPEIAFRRNRAPGAACRSANLHHRKVYP